MPEIKYNHHLLLVSEQAMPNFLPILDKETRPNVVTLVVSNRMRNRAEWLKKEIEKCKVEVALDIDIGDSEANIAAIYDILEAWSKANSDLFQNSVLNLTGGTKPMAIAAQELYRYGGRPIFYVDIKTNEVRFVKDDFKIENQRCVLLKKELKLAHLFGLNGLKLISGEFKSEIPNDSWRQFSEEVKAKQSQFARSLSRLNSLASAVAVQEKYERNKKKESLRLDDKGARDEEWEYLLDILRMASLIQGTPGDESFTSHEAAKFCNGIWLEHHVFTVLKELGFDKDHALLNAKIADVQTGERKNELDSIVIYKNTCFVIEDKTANMRKKDSTVRVDSAVYKLAQLTKTMGLRAKGILVSAIGVQKEDRDRARAYNVEVIDDLTRLKSELKRIMNITDK